MIIRIAGELIAAGGADHLGDVRINVQAFEFVAMAGKRIEEVMDFEPRADEKIFAISGEGSEIVKRLIHPAPFSEQDALHFRIAERETPVANPLRHALCNVQSLLIVAVRVHIEIAGHDFVQCVKWGPDAQALAKAVEKALWKRTEVAVGEFFLALREVGHDGVSLGFDSFVARSRVTGGARRDEMTGEIAAQCAFMIFPAAERLSGAGQTGVDAEIMYQTVLRQRIQVGNVGFRGLEEWAVQQAHVLERKRRNQNRNLILTEAPPLWRRSGGRGRLKI